MKTHNQVRFALLLGAAIGVTGTAHAQSGAATESAGAYNLGEIVVTAQKREQKLQDVPIQVNVLTGAALSDRQMKLTSDIVATIPNFTVERTDTYTNSVIVLRGLSQASNSDSPVAVIVDGVRQDDAKQFNMHLFDVDQIEVIKGPQGSLYGRSAEAGAIVINTKAPTNDMSGFADVSYGNGNTLDLSAGVSGAVVPDKVLFRLAGNYVSSDGIIRNVYRGDHGDKVDHDWNLRGNLLFNITDQISFSLIGQYGEFKAAGVIFAPVFSGNPNDFQKPQGNFPNYGNGSNASITGKFEAALDFVIFTSITGYTKLKQVQVTDVDFTNPVEQAKTPPHTLPFQAGDWQPFRNEIFSQEIRLVSPDHQPLRWLFSADYLHSKKFINTHLFLDTGNPYTDPTNPARTLKENPADYIRSAWGVSAQIDYDITEALTFTAGVRYDRDDRDLDDFKTHTRRTASFDAWQPRASLSYKIGNGNLVYASVGRGFRSGGFNPPSYIVPVYNNEILTNYEVGFKSQFLDRKLTVNGALFHSDVDNLQSYAIDFNSGSSVTSNIDKVKIDGAELEVVLTPVKQLDLFARMGLTNPKIKKFAANPAYVGNIIPRGYKASFNLGGDFEQELSSDLTFTMRGDVQLYSKKYWFVDNLDVQKSRTYANGSIGLKYQNFTATLWAKNIFNVHAYDTYFPKQQTGLPFDVAFPNRPRTYGVEVSAKF